MFSLTFQHMWLVDDISAFSPDLHCFQPLCSYRLLDLSAFHDIYYIETPSAMPDYVLSGISHNTHRSKEGVFRPCHPSPFWRSSDKADIILPL